MAIGTRLTPIRGDVLASTRTKMTGFSLCLLIATGMSSDQSPLLKCMITLPMFTNLSKTKTNKAAISRFKSKKKGPILCKSIKPQNALLKTLSNQRMSILMPFCSWPLGQMDSVRSCKEFKIVQEPLSKSTKCNLESSSLKFC